MKCFECGFRCITKYHTEWKADLNRATIQNPMGAYEQVVAVSKVCNMCKWESHPIKVPKPL
jgi:hypothetical protein